MKNMLLFLKRILLFVLAMLMVSILFMYRRSLWAAVLSPTRFHLLVGVIVLILVIIVFIILIFRSARKSPPPQALPEREPGPAIEEETRDQEQPAKFSKLKLRSFFFKADRWLRNKVSGKDFRYEIPRFLMVGEAGSGKTTVLGRGKKHIGPWCFFDSGVILDIPGHILFPHDSAKPRTREWHYVLRMLQKYRPRRPIDGIVLAIPCEHLMVSREQGNVSDQAAEKAEHLQESLRYAQKRLGIHLPIYVLVTKCDHIDGFQSFCGELPEPLHDNMFGWSNPHTADTAYSDKWVKDAFQSVRRELFQIQSEIFTGHAAMEKRDELFLFPSNFESVAAPVGIYLDHLFKKSAYHEPLILRGLYFCGKRGTESLPVFVKDLLEKKIFPEFGLAQPLRTALISRNRNVRMVQAAALLIALIGGVGLWNAYDHLQKDQDQMIRGFTKVKEDFIISSRMSGQLDFEESAQNLFDSMDNLRDMKYVFIPPSWFSDIHGNIRQSMFRAYNEIIVKAILKKLVSEAEAIFEIQGNDTSISIKKEDIQNILKKTPFAIFCEKAFADLYVFVKEVSKLQEVADKYNAFCVSKDMKGLNDVVENLFGKRLPQGFDKNIRTYNEYLQKSRYDAFDYGIFKIKAKSDKLEQLTNEFYDKLFQSHTITKASGLDVLSDELEKFARKKRSAERDGRFIRDLSDVISQTEQNLDHPEFAWISSDKFYLGESFDDILKMIGRSHFFGPDLQLNVEREGEAVFRRFKDRLKSKETLLTGPLLERKKNGNVVMALSSGVLAFKQDIEELLKQPFIVMKPIRGQTFAPPPGTRFTSWNTDLLKEVMDIFEPYEAYTHSGDKRRTKGLQRTIINDTAKNNLERKVRNMIAQARRLEPVSDGLGNQPKERFDHQLDETEVFRQIRNFKEAEKIFNPLLVHFRDLGLADAEEELLEVLSDQSSALLRIADEFLENEDIYRIRGDNFSWWDGKEKPSLGAFDATDQKELEYLMKVQRERIRHLAYQYAEPLVTFTARRNQLHARRNPKSEKGRFRHKSEEQEILFKWKTLLSALEDYENKKPSASLAVLEKFILFDMDEINETNYFKKVSQNELAGRSSDIFLQKRNELRKKLFEQCQRFAAEQIVKKYRAVKDVFDSELKGKFPFADVKKGQEVFSEANPESIRNFYRHFDEEATALKEVLKINDAFQYGTETFDFLAQMEQVRGFFAPYLDGTEGEAGMEKGEFPIFDLDVKFRANQKYERMGNKIIDWQMTVGNQVFRYGGDTRIGRWQFGDSISVSLRWAKNAMDYPVFADGGQTNVSIKERIVTYLFTNQWSLLRFLKMNAGLSEDFERQRDPKPHTLRFLIDTVRTGQEGEDEGKSQARVFIRIALLSPDKAKKVLHMPSFPTKSPDLIWMSDRHADLEFPPDAGEASPQDEKSQSQRDN